MSAGNDSLVIGLLYPGEMGTAIARVLRGRGYCVVTAASHRSVATRARCAEAGIENVASFNEVVRQANVVISLVTPDAAEEVVTAYCAAAKIAPRGAIFVDANSIGPALASLLAEKIEAAGVSFVDAAINGMAKNLTTSGTVILSGKQSNVVAELFRTAVRVKVLGSEPGRASAMKMLLSGMSKGICALYLELGMVAQQSGMLPEFSQMATEIYPGIMALVDRMLPTYAIHAARRAVEMHELETTVMDCGIEPCVVEAVWRIHEVLAGIDFATSAAPITVEGLIEKVAARLAMEGDGQAAQVANH
jgi:3-hydroxyisobutyrate dehydrogenase-like beta-hydroxyacid dehydrogenase